MDALEPNPDRASAPPGPAPTGNAGVDQLPTAAQAPTAGAARPSPLTPPFVLGHYRVVEKIGEGGMGAVYRAVHGRLKKTVALKLLPPGRTADSQAVSRFEREMEAIGRLNHNHIVRATDAGEADGVHYLVMELVNGVDLARLVRRVGPLPVAAACELVRQAAAGLQYAHENGLVHRDIKPSNLLLSVDGELKVSDLGLALLNRNEAASGELTVTGQVMGTADYMAPEQWEDSHAVDIRADLYSLGCTLYTLLVGNPPFGGPKHRSALRKMAAHAKELVRPITDHRTDVPAAVEELRLRLMAKEPADRPSTPAEVVKALEPFCRGADLAALARPRPDGPAPPDHSTATRPAEIMAPTPAAGRTLTTADLAHYRRGRAWRTAGLVVGAGLLAAAVTLVICLRPWTGAPGPLHPANGPTTPATLAAPEPERRGWRNLLAEQPTGRVWPRVFGARLDYDAEKEIVWVENSYRSLVRLGETDAHSYKLQIGLRQVRWTGYVGVYFGRPPTPGNDAFSFQMIELCPLGPNNPRAYRLVRLLGAVHPDLAPDARVSTRGFANWPLPQSPDTTEHLLELEVKAGALKAVSWNGVPCPDLVTEEADAAAGGAETAGEFGIYCDSSSVIVATARVLRTD